jgi:transposase
MPRDRATGKRREATVNERVSIIERHARGESYRKIEDATGVSKSQAQAIVKYWRDHGEIKPPPCSGPVPRLSERDKRHLRRLSDAHPRMTLAEITNEARVPVKPRTTENYLRAMNR